MWPLCKIKIYNYWCKIKAMETDKTPQIVSVTTDKNSNKDFLDYTADKLY